MMIWEVGMVRPWAAETPGRGAALVGRVTAGSTATDSDDRGQPQDADAAVAGINPAGRMRPGGRPQGFRVAAAGADWRSRVGPRLARR